MKDGLTEPTEWDVLADKLSSASDVPFATFSRPIAGATDAEIHRAYLALFGEALEATKAFAAQHPERDDIFTAFGEDAAPISYNMAMTRSTLVICPRIAEGAAISTPGGQVAGKLSLNGTVLAGTALVKSESEWDALRLDEAGATTLATVLSKIGIPNGAADSHRL
jgi:ATP adenylyltransferase